MKNKPKISAHRFKNSKFFPVTIGLITIPLVLFLLNAQYFSARIVQMFSPPPQVTAAEKTIVTVAEKDPNKEAVKVAPDPKIIIPAIEIDAPVIYGMTSVVERDIQRALQDGVLHYSNTPLPGQAGNAVYVGHSSNAPWAPGNYKFVFAPLERLVNDNIFHLNFEGKQYTYKVVNLHVVSPYDVSVVQPTDKPSATLITCTPVGTNLRRLVVRGEQILPTPTEAQMAPATTQAATILPGNN